MNKKLTILVVVLLISSLTGVFAGGRSEEAAPTRLAVATGGTAGVYFPLGGAFANIITERVDGVTANAESTGASVVNVNLLNNGEVDFALMQNDIAYYAFNGVEMFSDNPALTNLRGIAVLYPEVVQIVVNANAGIESVEDLRGRRVAVGAPGSGAEANARQILTAHGISYDDIRADFLSFAEAADALRDGNVDAAFVTAGTPTAAVTDVSTTHNVRLLSIDSGIANALMAEYPFYDVVTIPAGTYNNQAEDVQTVTVLAMLSVRAGLSDDMVYNITKGLFENLNMFAAAHARGGNLSLDSALSGMPLELHPGAARFYQEMGR
jgi:TRAP transporter TAXI family solute receptor